MSRVVVVGLDGLEPSLAFGPLAKHMPCLTALAVRGTRTTLASCKPPITVPAWACMVTGHDPGTLGLYGFNDRAAWDYTSRRLASSLAFAQPTLWHRATRAGKRSRIIGVPPSYPAQPLAGELVTCFLTPDAAAQATHPLSAMADIKHRGYVFDTPEFRVDEPAKAELARDIHVMIERRFALARDWIARDDWDLFMLVEMGGDRAHHAFWRYLDPTHPAHVASHPLERTIADVYAQLDDELGRLLALLRDDDHVLVVSDHGACPLRGGFAINDWLAAHGFLQLRNDGGGKPKRFDASDVDWSRTCAWADGGYVGRIHVNIRGREPQGIVDPSDVPRLLERIKAAPAPLPLLIEAPRDIYAATRGYAPALLVEAGDLEYRCLASTGHASLLVTSNDTGPDDANHGRRGVLVSNRVLEVGAAPSLYAVAPLVAQWLTLA